MPRESETRPIVLISFTCAETGAAALVELVKSVFWASPSDPYQVADSRLGKLLFAWMSICPTSWYPIATTATLLAPYLATAD